MSVARDTAPSTIAGHAFVLQERAGDVLKLRIALQGAPLVALARALARLDGVRVGGGPEGTDRAFVVSCQGFKMILSAPAEEAADFASALVSRTPQATLAVMSDLGGLLEDLMREPPAVAEPAPAAARGPRRSGGAREAPTGSAPTGSSTPLNRSPLPRGKPLVRKTELKRKTPLARGPFKRS